MTRFKSAFHGILMTGAAFGLAGCETTGSAWNDLKNGFSNLGFSSGAPEEAAAASTHCPAVTIAPDLGALHQFTDANARREENRISSVRMTGVQSSCAENDDNLILTLDITFEGDLGPRGVANAMVAPSFSYPYFLTIDGQGGAQIAREVFAVTLAYPTGQTVMTQKESLRQIIPANGIVAGQAQQVTLGMQVTDADMAYNRALTDATLPAAARAIAAPASLLGDADPEILAAQKAEDAKKAMAKKKKAVKKKVKPPLPKEKPAAPVTAAPEPAAATETTAPAATTTPAVVETPTSPATDMTVAPAPADSTAAPVVDEVPPPADSLSAPTPAAPVTPPANDNAAPAKAEEEGEAKPGAIPAMPTESAAPTPQAGEALDDLFDMTIPPEETPAAKP